MNKLGQKIVTENQLKGNWAEQYIMEQLSLNGCLVRHVQQGHDIGIDLYCESTALNRPFLHFFVQVKASKTLRFKNKAKEISYWERQPVPVFIFHVKKRGHYDIYSALHFILKKKKKEKDYYLKINESRIENKTKLQGFFEKTRGLLVKNYFEWSLLKGNISPIPSLAKTKMSWFFEGKMQLPAYKDKIKRSLFLALWRFCEDNFLKVNIFNQDKLKFKRGKNIYALNFVKNYMEALKSCELDFKHSESPKVTIGLWYAAKKEYSEAKKCIESALKIVERQSKKNKKFTKKEKVNLAKKLKGYKNYLEMIKKHGKNM